MDLIDRQAAIEALNRESRCGAVIDHCGLETAIDIISELPSVQQDDWMERNKDRILQAGKEGREVEFRIGGRLFAIRELAQ